MQELERENMQQRAELIEANAQAFRELQKQEFIISSYIPEEYLVCVLFIDGFIYIRLFFVSETCPRKCNLE